MRGRAVDRKRDDTEPEPEAHPSSQPRRYRLDTNRLTLELSTKETTRKPKKSLRSQARRHHWVDINNLTPVLSTKGLLLWGGLITVSTIPLSAIAHYTWWLILIFGVVMPIALGVGSRIAGRHKSNAQPHSINYGEKELLAVLEQYGELTPLAVATKTSLPVSEADQMLSRLAQRGYVEVKVAGAKISYALWGRGDQVQQSSN